MKKIMVSILLMPFLCAEVLATPKIATYYDNSSRTVYTITDGSSPTVYFAGTKWGSCIGNGNVHSMNFMPESKIEVSVEAQLKAEAKAKGLGASGLAASKGSASYTTPAVYSYNFTGITSNLHFNVIANKNGTYGESGWQPDTGGGCTYKIPVIEIEYLYNMYTWFFGNKNGQSYACYGSLTCQNFNTGNKIAIRNSDGFQYIYVKRGNYKDFDGWYEFGYR
ncbi:hypothetical protein [Candidatus Parabeggiatoa sp. HSG14]|uniref:hypothetical protein n=1 Tax=Candidatus Parabeggiatoa sp. HSG14 TaxID=3055593 RepID=UPI0025A92734|nr:hypothetical protein [Thiotrichales bacterium HSG14]